MPTLAPLPAGRLLTVVALAFACALALAAAPAHAVSEPGVVDFDDAPTQRIQGGGIGVEALGAYTRAVGDVNGDGIDDLAMSYEASAYIPGSSLRVGIIFGRKGFSSSAPYRGEGPGGLLFAMKPFPTFDVDIRGIARAGDVNGDGYDDVLVNVNGRQWTPATSWQQIPEAAYLLYGGPQSGQVDAAALGDRGMIVRDLGVTNENGTAVAPAGDVDDDGYADLLVGSTVLFGGPDLPDDVVGPPDGMDLSRPAGSTAPVAAGDVDGDGADDLAVGLGVPSCDGTSCSRPLAVVLGGKGVRDDADLTTPLGDRGYLVDSTDADVRTKLQPVGSAGDFDGDGVGDLMMAGTRSVDGGAGTPTLWVLFGTTAKRSGTVSPEQHAFRAATSATIGPGADAYLARTRAIGDLDADGRDDLATWALRGAVSAQVVYGRDDDAPPIADLTKTTPQDGFVIAAVDPVWAGDGGPSGMWGDTAAGGDFDDDGRLDLAVAAPYRGIPPETPGGRHLKAFDYGTVFVMLGEKDTDGDGLPDKWETDGVDGNGDGVPDFFPKDYGADPNRKQVFVEIDYMKGHRPTPTGLLDVIDLFDHAPVDNPDGTKGIDLVTVIDDEIPHEDEIQFAGFASNGIDLQNTRLLWDGTEAERARGQRVINAKRKVFHYALWAHRESQHPTAAGIAYTYDSESMVLSHQTDAEGREIPLTPEVEASTFLHELGHNLGLNHGGGDRVNCKPNYLSAMNYAFGYRGEPVDDWHLELSDTLLPLLNETNLRESVPIGTVPREVAFGPAPVLLKPINAPVDYNRDGKITTNGTVAADLNNLGSDACPGDGTSLAGYDDWANLRYDFRRGVEFAPLFGQTEPELPDEASFDAAVAASGDADGDGVRNLVDNCRDKANADQHDDDRDGVGDACDATPHGPDGDGGGDGPPPPPTPPGGGGAGDGGRVIVTPPPSTGATPPGRDRTAPRLTGLRRTATGFSWKLSEAAKVTIAVTRSGHRVARLTVSAPKGAGRIRFARRSRAGRYRAELRATDRAGNRSTARRLAFRR